MASFREIDEFEDTEKKFNEVLEEINQDERLNDIYIDSNKIFNRYLDKRLNIFGILVIKPISYVLICCLKIISIGHGDKKEKKGRYINLRTILKKSLMPIDIILLYKLSLNFKEHPMWCSFLIRKIKQLIKC